MKTILLKWTEIAHNSAILNVPDDFDLSADNDDTFGTAVYDISMDAVTYDSGYNEAFEAAAMEYRPDAEAMFFEKIAESGPADPGPAEPDSVVLPVRNSAIVYAMRAANSHDKHVMSILPFSQNNPGIEIVAEADTAVSAFMSALAEKTGRTLADLTRGGYESDPEPTDPDDGSYCWHYFPAVLIVADEDAAE